MIEVSPSHAQPCHVEARSARPFIEILDARVEDLDAEGLRTRARSHPDALAAPFRCRSYRYPFALVAWHDKPVGVDIERIGPTDGALARVLCTPGELAERDRGNDRDRWLLSLWSAKEALAKVLGDAVAYEPSRLGSPARWPEGRAGRFRAETLEVAAGYVAWLCWRDQPGAHIGGGTVAA